MGVRSIAVFGWRNITTIISFLLLILTFVAVAWSDISSGQGSHWYWTALAFLFGITSCVMQWGRARGSVAAAILKPVVLTALHWVTILVAVQIVYAYVNAGRFTNEATGLVNGLLLAVGVFLSGVYADWRLMVVGAALSGGLLAVSYLEEYELVLSGIALGAGAVILIGTYLRAKRLAGDDEG